MNNTEIKDSNNEYIGRNNSCVENLGKRKSIINIKFGTNMHNYRENCGIET